MCSKPQGIKKSFPELAALFAFLSVLPCQVFKLRSSILFSFLTLLYISKGHRGCCWLCSEACAWGYFNTIDWVWAQCSYMCWYENRHSGEHFFLQLFTMYFMSLETGIIFNGLVVQESFLLDVILMIPCLSCIDALIIIKLGINWCTQKSDVIDERN